MWPTASPPSTREYWDWLTVALFLLLTVDLLTTMAAARVAGIGAESNPLMAWALGEGVRTLVVLHLLALVASVLLFAAVTGRIETTPAVRSLRRSARRAVARRAGRRRTRGVREQPRGDRPGGEPAVIEWIAVTDPALEGHPHAPNINYHITVRNKQAPGVRESLP